MNNINEWELKWMKNPKKEKKDGKFKWMNKTSKPRVMC
jgi:hypothetical protein